MPADALEDGAPLLEVRGLKKYFPVTDALGRVRDVMLETEQYGFDKVKAEQLELGQRVRAPAMVSSMAVG